MSSSALIWVLNGPNLNRLGQREPEIYGRTSLTDIHDMLRRSASEHGVTIDCFQTNHEGVMIDRIHQAAEAGVSFILINPAAFTHTSVAIRDALASVSIPFVEIHISNVHRREAFRHRSYMSDLAEAVIAGLGPFGYRAALDYAVARLNGNPSPI